MRSVSSLLGSSGNARAGAPVIAFIAQIYLVYLLVVNLETFGGVGSFGGNIPYIGTAIFLFGLVWGLALRFVAPTTHAKIGRLVFTGG